MSEQKGPVHVHQPQAPYRAARLAPPRAPTRWQRPVAAALSALVTLVGVAFYLLTSRGDGAGAPRVLVPRRVLVGPDGSDELPLRGPLVVNVWLQGCEDCRDAFEAARALEAQGVWARWPVRNVSFGEADERWAAEFGVRRGLRHDAAGSLVVQPWSISTFTTVVLDRAGHELWRGRPGQEGFVASIDAALASTGR